MPEYAIMQIKKVESKNMNTITNYKDFLEMADAVQLMGFASELNLEFVGKNNSIDALITLLTIFKTISPSKTNQERSEINAILIFLYICKHNQGVLSKDLEKFLSSRQSTISRNLTKLSDPNDIYNKKGRGLVRGIEDPYERRRKKWFLTDKGEALRDKINQVFKIKESQSK